MKRRRTKPELIMAILKKCGEGAIQTHVQYECNLSYRQVLNYLSLCMGKNWLKKNGNIYTTTSEGNAFLKQIKRAMDMLEG